MKGKIIQRPSKICKSPYVADVELLPYPNQTYNSTRLKGPFNLIEECTVDPICSKSIVSNLKIGKEIDMKRRKDIVKNFIQNTPKGKETISVESVLVHTPALGCGGLQNRESVILMSPIEKKRWINKKLPKDSNSSKILYNNDENRGLKIPICEYRSRLAYLYEPKLNSSIIVGTDPKLAEDLIYASCQKNELSFLRNTLSLSTQKKIPGYESRFDFVGIDAQNRPFVMEVKNVPLADYQDCTKSERQKMNPSIFQEIPWNNKIAYFPDGYRKRTKDPISPRALKHLQELICIKQKGVTMKVLDQNNDKTKIHQDHENWKTVYRSIMCFVIQREDVNSFTPSIIDPIYRDCFYDAHSKGVEIYAVQYRWDKDGKAYLVKDQLDVVGISVFS